MATVVGIFEENFKNKKPLPIVKPGSQTRRFTHINDTVNACIIAWKKNKCRHYSVASNKSYSISNLQDCLIVRLNTYQKDQESVFHQH